MTREQPSRIDGTEGPTLDMPRHLHLAVIGAGMAGALAAITLQEAGLIDFTVCGKAERVGGTWRENTYP